MGRASENDRPTSSPHLAHRSPRRQRLWNQRDACRFLRHPGSASAARRVEAHGGARPGLVSNAEKTMTNTANFPAPGVRGSPAPEAPVSAVSWAAVFAGSAVAAATMLALLALGS